MTEFSNSNSHKGTIEGNDGVKITVVRNTTVAGNVSEHALWLKREGKGNGFYDVYGIDAARELHEYIGQALAELDQIVENAKPKPLTAGELSSLPTGAEVHENDRRYIKTNSGQFVKIDNGTGSPYFPVGTLYTIDELAGFAYIDEEN